MGMAKYYEDNIEIIEDRFRMWRHGEYLHYYQEEVNVSNNITTKIIETVEKKKNAKKKTKVIECCQCGREFQFTGGEQHYYEKHNLLHPKRCPECRNKRKETFKANSRK